MENKGIPSKSFATSIRFSLLILIACFAMTIPTLTFAETEITGVIGGLVGGDLNDVLQGNVSVKGSFDNGPLYGVRVGWIGRFFGLEGSFVGSPSGVSLSLPIQQVALNAKVYYLEGNVLFIPIPGPISPFFTAGGGLHSYNFDLLVGGGSLTGADIQKFGYNFGGGLKINISHIVIRGEVRDHVTSISLSDFGVPDFPVDPGFDTKQNLHNVEISAGVGIRF